MATEPSRRRPASLALRVTAFVGLATTLVFIVYGWIIIQSLEHHFADQDASELTVVVEAIQRTREDLPADTDNAVLRSHLASAVRGHHGIFFNVSDASGQRIYATPGPDLTKLAANAPVRPKIELDAIQVWRENGKHVRGGVVGLDISAAGALLSYRVIVANDMDSRSWA